MRVKFFPRRKHRKIWLAESGPTQKQVETAIFSIMNTSPNYDSYPDNLTRAYFGEDLITPRVLIREGYYPVDHEALFGPWHLPSGDVVPFAAVVYDLATGG